MKKFIKLTDSEAQSAINTLIPYFNPKNEKIAEIIATGNFEHIFYMTTTGTLYDRNNKVGVTGIHTFNPPDINVKNGTVGRFDIIKNTIYKPLYIVGVWGLLGWLYYLWSPSTDEYKLLTGFVSGAAFYFLTKRVVSNNIRVFAFQSGTKELLNARCADINTETLEFSEVPITGVSNNLTKFVALWNTYGEGDIDNSPFYLFVANDEGGVAFINIFDDIDVSEEGILTINSQNIASLPSYNSANKYFSATGSTLSSAFLGLLEKSEGGTFFRTLAGNSGNDIEVLDTNDDLKSNRYFVFPLDQSSMVITTHDLLNNTASTIPTIFVPKENLKITSVNSSFEYSPTNTFPHELEQYRITKVQFVSQQDNQFTLKFTGDIGTENLIIYYNPAAEIPNVDYITINGITIKKGQEVEVNIFDDFSITLSVFAIKFKKKDGTTKTYSAVKFVKKDGTSKTYTSVKLVKKGT